MTIMFQQKFKVRTVIPLLLQLTLGQQFNNSGQELLVTVKNISVSKLCVQNTKGHDATMLSQTNEQSSSYVIWHVVSSSFDCSLTKGTSDSPFFPKWPLRPHQVFLCCLKLSINLKFYFENEVEMLRIRSASTLTLVTTIYVPKQNWISCCQKTFSSIMSLIHLHKAFCRGSISWGNLSQKSS